MAIVDSDKHTADGVAGVQGAKGDWSKLALFGCKFSRAGVLGYQPTEFRQTQEWRGWKDGR